MMTEAQNAVAQGDATQTDFQPKNTNTDRLIQYHQVIALLGAPVHKTTLWRWEKAGLFPKRIKLGSKTVVWSEHEIMAFRDSRREHA